MILATRDINVPAEGVFFIVPVPHGWQLCTFRADDFGPISLPDCWPATLVSMLNIWLRHFEEHDPANCRNRHTRIENAIAHLISICDAIPRGRVRRGVRQKQFIVRHGGEMTEEMKVTRREIEETFGLEEPAHWIADHHLRSTPADAKLLREFLPIREAWEAQPAAI